MAEYKKILIAEDSSVIQNLTKKILEMQNYHIESVKNGVQVLEKLEKNSFDVILLDINMPKMGGMECARKVRDLKDDAKKNIPIIAVTGNAMNYSMKDFKEVGINEFITKPLDFDALVNLVKEYTK